MPNRVIYNTEDIFVGSPNIDNDSLFNFIPNHQILKRLNRIQSVSYQISTASQKSMVLGVKSAIDQQKIAPPQISVDISYLTHGIENEIRCGMYVRKDEQAIRKNLFSLFVDSSRNYDRRNYYFITNQCEENVRDGTESYIHDINLDYDLGDLPLMTDPHSPKYDVLSFQNCYLKSYSQEASVGSIGTCSIGLEADNAVFFTSGSGIGIPVFDAKSGTIVHSGENFIIPKRFKESDDKGLLQALVFRNGDIEVEITKNEVVTETIYTSDWGIVSAPGDHGWTNIRASFDYMGSPDYAQFYATTANDTHYMYQDFTEITVGKRYRIQGSLYIPSANPKGDGIIIEQGNRYPSQGNIIAQVGVGITNQWVSFDVSFTAESLSSIERIYIYGIDSSASDPYVWGGGSSSSYDFFRFGNIVITEIINTPTLHNDKVQSVSFEAAINRRAIQYLNYKAPYDKLPELPIEASAQIEFLADTGAVGDIAPSMKENQNYDIAVKLKSQDKTIIRYDLLGATLVSHQSQGSIGSNKSSSLSFTCSMDLDNDTRGLFISGSADLAQIEVTDVNGSPITYNGEEVSVGTTIQY